MKATEVIEGLQIIEKYRPSTDSPYHVRTYDDQIAAGGNSHVIPEADQVRLIELGWYFDEDIDGWVI